MSIAAQTYFLGVDGGGSKTLALIINEQGQVCGHGQAGSTNHYVVGKEQAQANLHEAVSQAVNAAGSTLPLAAAWFGLAGVDRAADHIFWRSWLQSYAGLVYISNDVELILSALEDLTGVALIAGTGSIALARDQYGQLRRVGGWGHLLGDEGSGYDLGLSALRAALRAYDGRGEKTLLLERILEHWELSRGDDMLERAYDDVRGKGEIARLAPLVLQVARAGDATAMTIMRQRADELALTAFVASQGLSFPAPGAALVLGGSLLLQAEDYREMVIQSWRRHQPTGKIVLDANPAASAAQAARNFTSEGIETEFRRRTEIAGS